MSKRYTLKGINDEQDTCEHCGKMHLKRIAWLAELDADGNEGEVIGVGMDCAGKLLGWNSKKTRQKNDILNDFDVVVAKACNVEKYGKEAIISWINRLHSHLLGNSRATVESLVLTQKLDGVAVSMKVW